MCTHDHAMMTGVIDMHNMHTQFTIPHHTESTASVPAGWGHQGLPALHPPLPQPLRRHLVRILLIAYSDRTPPNNQTHYPPPINQPPKLNNKQRPSTNHHHPQERVPAQVQEEPPRGHHAQGLQPRALRLLGAQIRACVNKL